MKRRRLNGLTRWGGAAACAALMMMYAAHLGWTVDWWPAERLCVACGDGAFGVSWYEGEYAWMLSFARVGEPPGPTVRRRTRPVAGWDWLPRCEGFSGRITPMFTAAVIPLWLPLVLASVPTTPGWRSHRRSRRVGLCPECRHDLTGLPATAPCPECGRARA